MLVRHIVIPASADKLWDALTEPESMSAWFGGQMEWDLRPGGQARFLDDDGTRRRGVIESVRPGRHLRFRWWPEGEGPAGAQRAASEVSYDLEPDEDGTRLTVTEQPVRSAPVASRPRAAAEPWTNWDSRMFGCWAQASAPALAALAVR